MNDPAVIRKKNRSACILVLVALVLACILLALPAYEFNSEVYTVKSNNTFVGDETYQQIRNEMEELQKEYADIGLELTYNEDVISRINSKGETTSMVIFSLNRTCMKSGWSLLSAGITSTGILLAIVICLVLGVGSLFCGLAGSSDEPWRLLDSRARILRTAACIFLFAAAVLVPVLFMANNYDLSRRVYLYVNELISPEGRDIFFGKLDTWLFDGLVGDGIAGALEGLTFHSLPWMWLTLPCFLAAALGAVQVRFGAIRQTVVKVVLWICIILVCLITLYPYFVMLTTGFRSSAETNDMYFLNILPTKWVWSNLKDVIDRGVLQYLLNSLLIAGGATVIALVCGIPAAYALARMRFRGKNVFLGFVLMTQMFSPVVMLIGIARLISAMGLNDSLFGLMFINAAFNQAFAIWLLRGIFASISPEMEQAGRLDGCTALGSLRHILLPIAAPGIVTTLIFVFINAWNEYTISTVLISTASKRPISVGITQFSSLGMIEWQYLFTASLLATIPVVILFICIEKHLTVGIGSGGVKG